MSIQSHYINNARLFLTFASDNKMVNVETGVFYHLSHKGYMTKENSLSIKDKDLILLEKCLREKSSESYLNTLYYIIFHISLNTEFRISQIVNLEIDCVKEAMKSKQYVIVSNTKVTNGDKTEQPISIYVKRHIDTLLNFTSELRADCIDTNISKHLFIYTGYQNSQRVIKAKKFNKHLKSCCEEIGISEYTATNLRKTYLSNADEYAIKNGWSLTELKSVAGHRNIDTTNNHYISRKIRTLLESTYGIIIGDVSLNGTVTNDSTIEQTKENTVDDGCGICKSDSCILTSNLDCPMCPNYIVLLSSLPLLESKVRHLSNLISNSTVQHEKEHLYNIKRLYIAYIEKLYELKENLKNE